MNKLTKVGLSALCGSLAAVASASAGELTVKGGATATWSSNSGDVTGNPIGLSSGMTLTGSGELDNGATFALTMTHADQDAWSAGSLAITSGLGELTISSANGGTGIGGYDDKMPTAWEETWGTSLGTGIDLAKGSSSSMNVQYKTPGAISLALTYSGHNDLKQVADKGVSGAAGGSVYQRSGDVVLNADVNGQNIFVGYSVSDRDEGTAASGQNPDNNNNREEAVGGAVFSIGPVKIGAQATVEYLGNEKTATDVFGYRNVAYGVSFNISDNLSASYGHMESKKGFVSTETPFVLMEIDSIQLAYTMGGATIKIAETDVDNAVYTSGTSADKDATTVALSLAF